MIIDSHQHFWEYNPVEYGWMGEDMRVLKRDFLPADLRPLMSAAGVSGTLAVQARRTVRETEWLLGLAERHSFIRGVVGWLDMSSPSYRGELARLAADRRLRGIRELIHDMKDKDFALSDAHVRAVGALGDHALTYDLLLRPQHLEAAARLADRLPQQPFVVDHIAKPDIRGGQWDDWARDLRALAERPNVWCKVSGLVTEADWEQWTYAQLEPYVDLTFSTFGPDRVMFGSDWPVATCAATYPDVVGVAKRYAGKLAPDERAAFLAGNARRLYGLDETGDDR